MPINKVKIAAIIGIVVSAIQVFFPQLTFEPGFEAAITVIVMTIAAWVTPESSASISSLKLKG